MRMGSQLFEVRVSHQPPEIVVALVDGTAERHHGCFELAHQRITAREVVKHGRVVRAEPRQLLIDLQPPFKSPPLRIIIAENLQRLDVLRIALDDALQKTDFDIEVSLLRRTQLLSRFLGHTLELFAKRKPKSSLSGES